MGFDATAKKGQSIGGLVFIVACQRLHGNQGQSFVFLVHLSVKRVVLGKK